MIPVTGTAQIYEAMQDVKNRGPGFVTNFFSTEAKLARWVDKRELSIAPSDRSVILLRRDRDFEHLYFFASDLAAVRAALQGQAGWTTPLVADLIGREAEILESAALFVDLGYRHHTRLMRLSRIGGGSRVAPPSPDAELALASDAAEVLAMLEASFDRHAEQLPDEGEIAAAIAQGCILVVRDGARLAGLLFFERTGLTAYVRYWLVARAFRDKGVGARLMHGFFARCPDARRFILWVIADNENAIKRYAHYGFKPDGLVDQVMIRYSSPIQRAGFMGEKNG
ncbi:MAG: GNAT family N-acetyltransferase [Deltaproteobacteria bacterium]|nr:GNAT family N-acetyltransferase [Deltaproteobacteria bacterium]